MADDPSPDNSAEPVRPAPTVPKPPRDPIVLEGVATDVSDGGSATAAQAAAPEPAPPAPPPPPAPAKKASAFAYGVSGAVIGAALALGAAWIYDPRAAPLGAMAERQDAMEKADAAETAASKALAARIAALESGQAALAKTSAVDALAERVAKLEGDLAKPDPHVAAEDALDKRLGKLESGAASTDSVAAAAAEARAARDTAAKALAMASAPAKASTPTPSPEAAGIAATEARVAALVAEATTLSDRVTKLETVQAAPKSETRVAPSEPAPVDTSAAKAIAAIALDQRMRAGEPFAAEWAALSRLGADPAKLAALKPYAESGAPSLSSLGAAFAAASPAILAAAHPHETDGGAWDKVLDHVNGLVKVHKVAEAPGEDPDALVTQVAAALARGQVGAALEAFGRLPEADRKAAGDWPDKARALVAANAAARALRDVAITDLAAAKN